MEGLRKILEQMAALHGRGRAAAGLAVLAVVLAVGAVAWLAQRADYALLYADLPDAEAGRVVEKLRAAQVPFRLSADGRSLSVPYEKVAELRLELAADGVVHGGGTGLELFERGPFGQTDLAEQVTYTRALQGELARTISALEPVEQAMVHLGRPRQSPFAQDARPATASVVLRLRSGRSLSPRQLAGIRELVAASVEGLDAARVSILDESGTALAGPGAGGEEQGGLDQERSTEEHLTRKAQTLLDAALGANRAIVRIAVRLTREKVEERREKLDPKAVARSEQTTSRTTREAGERSATGAGAATNVPGAGPAELPGRSREETEETTHTDYEVARTTSVVVREAGAVERLTVGLLLDAALDPKTAGVEAIVKEAVGFDGKRGDTFEVKTVPFAAGAAPLADVSSAFDAASKRDRNLALFDSGIAAFAVLASAGIGLLAVRRAAKLRGEPAAPPAAPGGALAGREPGRELASVGAVDEAARRSTLRTSAARSAAESPDAAGRVIDRWLTGEGRA